MALWTAKINESFVVEVNKENYCNGTLHIFEIIDDRKIHVFKQNVTVECNALGWPDLKCIDRWRAIATSYVEYLN
jgi:hypothetical protein